MKRILLFTACAAAMLGPINADAQLGVSKAAKKVVPTLTLGAKLGANMQHMSGSGTNTWTNAYKPGILGGVFVSVTKKNMGVRVEGLIKTAKFDLNNTNISVNTVNLDIPALFELKVVKRVWVQVGPQFTSVIKAKTTTGTDYKNNLKSSDISAVAGIEVTLPMKLTVSGRYIMGLANVNNTNLGGTWRNSSMQFAVGYRFLN